MNYPKALAKVLCAILTLTLLALAAAFFFIPRVGSAISYYGFKPYWASLLFLYFGLGMRSLHGMGVCAHHVHRR